MALVVVGTVGEVGEVEAFVWEERGKEREAVVWIDRWVIFGGESGRGEESGGGEVEVSWLLDMSCGRECWGTDDPSGEELTSGNKSECSRLVS